MTDSSLMPVVGLGTLCLTSQTLKQMGLKKSSMPFDWIFSSPEMVEHAIRDDFKEFLDRGNLKSVPVELRPERHLYRADNIFYRDNYGIKYIFNHHDPDWNDDDYNYFCRCVDRFRATRNGTERVLFLLFQHSFGKPDESQFPTYFSIAQLLKPHALLCVEAFHLGGDQPRYEAVTRVANLEIGRFGYASSCNGLTFGSFADFDAITKVIEHRSRIGARDRSEPRGPRPEGTDLMADAVRDEIASAQAAIQRALELLPAQGTALAEANARTKAMQIVLSAVLDSQGWRGLDRRKFRRLIAEASGLIPNSGPLAVQHEVLLAASRKVLKIEE